MNEFRADLHCHTTSSDGSMRPVDIIRHAAEIGLKGLSITDHDTINAYETSMPLAKELGIDLISGVEFSSMYKDVSVHILAYSFSLKNPLIHEFCRLHHARRTKRNLEMLNRLNDAGMPLSESDLQAALPQDAPYLNRIIGRPHIAQAMINKGYVFDVQQAFKRYIGEGKPCYVAGDYFSPEETIDLIHQAKGLAVIAHPHLVNEGDTILKLLKMDFDGIECYYSKFKPADHKRWVKIAQRKGWLITGGSDFHGDLKPMVSLGCSWVGDVEFAPLKARFLENN